jgi:precorrin-8X/cobalt-precorrin-8 methylmutase
VIAPPTRRYDYVTVPDDIYRRSFATIRSETDLSRLPPEMRPVAVRMIHACGDIDLVNDLAFHRDVVSKARAALAAQAVIFTDTQMLAAGITRRRLPADNDVLCLLDDPRTAELAARWEQRDRQQPYPFGPSGLLVPSSRSAMLLPRFSTCWS